jgi:hypothetical protein
MCEWASRVTPPVDGEWPVVVRPHRSSKRRPHLKKTQKSGKNKNMVIGHDGTRNQDCLCWRGSAEVYCSCSVFKLLNKSIIGRDSCFLLQDRDLEFANRSVLSPVYHAGSSRRRRNIAPRYTACNYVASITPKSCFTNWQRVGCLTQTVKLYEIRRELSKMRFSRLWGFILWSSGLYRRVIW